MVLALLALLVGCNCNQILGPRGVSEDEAVTYALYVNTPFSLLEIPPQSRPQGEPPVDIPILGPWTEPQRGKKDKGKRVRRQGVRFVAPNPIRPRGLFFAKPPAGLEMVDANGEVVSHKYIASNRAESFWSYNRDHVFFTVRNPDQAVAPEPSSLFLRYPKAVQRERHLNFVWSGVERAEDFVRATVQLAGESRSGLLLPAPAKASFEVTVPKMAELRFAPGIAPAEALDAPPSDGARLRVELSVAGEDHVLYDAAVGSDFSWQQIDLSAYAGQQATLSLITEPAGDPRFDYVFLAEPVLGSLKAHPRRVVMIFVDTLRPDHLPAYGYQRGTTPNTARFAKGAAVFEQARSVAPWTLPSTKALLTGRQPEWYDRADTLPGRLRQAGFATGFFAGNLYLGANFGLNRDWGTHHVTLWPSAKEVVDNGLAWLDAHDGQDAFLMLHFMDAHLPYQEKKVAPELRHKWAGDAPPSLQREAFELINVRRARRQLGPEGRQYVQDRYDQTLFYIDRELQRIYDRLDEDDVVVFFSDHGEEFWDHGGFEHGHSLYDELLHVPLIIRGPGVMAGRVSAPVSLLDVTPTILDMVGLDPSGMDGRSLLTLSGGDPAAVEAFGDRDQAFGRPLYGTARWGVLHGQMKYATHDGRETLFDLADDPGEKHNLFLQASGDAGAPYRKQLGDALGTEVVLSYRLISGTTRMIPEHDLVAEFTVPGGVERVWKGANPTRNMKTDVEVEGERVRVTWNAGWRGFQPVYVLPKRPLAEVTPKLSLTSCYGDQVETAEVTSPGRTNAKGTLRLPLMRTRDTGRGVFVEIGIAPIPPEGSVAVVGYDPELAAELKAMGYAVGDDDEGVQGLEGVSAPKVGVPPADGASSSKGCPIPTSSATPDPK